MTECLELPSSISSTEYRMHFSQTPLHSHRTCPTFNPHKAPNCTNIWYILTQANHANIQTEPITKAEPGTQLDLINSHGSIHLIINITHKTHERAFSAATIPNTQTLDHSNTVWSVGRSAGQTIWSGSFLWWPRWSPSRWPIWQIRLQRTLRRYVNGLHSHRYIVRTYISQAGAITLSGTSPYAL